MSAPGAESFLEFYDRYSRKLWELLGVAARSTHDVVAVTRVRNFLATPIVVRDGAKTQVQATSLSRNLLEPAGRFLR